MVTARNMVLAERCALLSAEVLKSQGKYSDAATLLIKMTSEVGTTHARTHAHARSFCCTHSDEEECVHAPFSKQPRTKAF